MSSSTFFLYTGSNNIAASRHFYSDLIGLEQIWDDADQIAYRIAGEIQFSVSYDPNATINDGWSFQPGWAFGLGLEPVPRSARASWSIPLSPQTFQSAVARLQDAGVEVLRPDPTWVGYWSYVVRGPMGQTVELADATTIGP
ncbi:VOC family protein [Arthrobacter sp. TMS2-4]